ncbi:MAG: PIN domain-containing protein [Chloroflexi bacterium]|nr:PIN domain-containing protein [Chloroflexota bacterium]
MNHRSAIFVDTGPWIAWLDVRDQWRQDAMREMVNLKAQRRSLVTTNWVLAEAYSGLVHRVARGTIARLRAMVEESALIRVVWIDRLIEGQAWRKFLQYDDKDVSMVDCTSFVVMEQLGLSTAFTFDRHFLQVGFQTWAEL